MRIAVLSDVHANLEALDAVLARADELGAERHWVLGDLVGYNADPDAVLMRLDEIGATLLAGNHDLAATGRFDVTWFNRVAAEAIRWTADRLGRELLDRLRALEPRRDADGTVLVHGSVADPAAEYVVNISDARSSFDEEPFGLCFFGHTHLPSAFVRSDGEIERRPLPHGEPLRLEDGWRSMVNPGSVGQPRDGDPRASFLIFEPDDRVVTVHRVAYDVAGAQAKIRAAGLPDVLADRLGVGR